MMARYHLVSLGCAKNTVDSESMGRLLQGNGFTPTDTPEDAEVVIVNTCGFIAPARHESFSVLRQLAQVKRPGQLLIAAGCLTQRYGAQVIEAVPEIDGVLGTRRWVDVLDLVHSLRSGGGPSPAYHLPEPVPIVMDAPGVPRTAVQGGSAYLKIADGCRRPCAFCAIPLIKGTAVSRPAAAIVAEARQLQAQGVHELVLIAQDTTDYGHDRGEAEGLASLLEELAEAVPAIPWIRLLYAYPGAVSDRLIEVMASHDNIIPYLDMPLQHANPNVLRAMRRPANVDWVHRTLEKMRRAMPDLALRTTFLVGYPGEGEAEFESLLEFVREIEFDRVGAFTFSFEPGTGSEVLGDPIPEDVKQQRKDRLMTVQQAISLRRNQAQVGKVLRVLIEGQSDGLSVGRSYRDAPEIDGLVLVDEPAESGSMVDVRIHGALPYDLTGSLAPRTS
jgi:ribosomal protein S12 methylthiotransferase